MSSFRWLSADGFLKDLRTSGVSSLGKNAIAIFEALFRGMRWVDSKSTIGSNAMNKSVPDVCINPPYAAPAGWNRFGRMESMGTTQRVSRRMKLEQLPWITDVLPSEVKWVALCRATAKNILRWWLREPRQS